MIRCGTRLIVSDLKKLYNIIPSLRPVFELQHTRSTGFCNPIFRCNPSLFSHQSTVASPPAAEIDPETIESDLETAKLLTNPQIISILGIMQQFGFTETDVTELVINQPTLQKTRANSWSETIETLTACGFENAEILSILKKWPKVLTIKKSDLVNRLNAWTESGLGEQLMFQVLNSTPQYLDLDHAFVSKRIKQYQLYFENKKRVGKLFLLAPNTLEESWSTVIDKLNFLNELCTDKSDIVSSGVLAHSSFHIKARHEFLIRAGIYKRPSKDFKKKLSKNPKLESIVNKRDDEFVSELAGLSLFEYEVFLEMFKEELHVSEAGFDSDDEEMYKLNYKRNRK